jgi:hypothetical protein
VPPARSWAEIQVSQQGPGRGVLAQRGRHDSREAVGACALQRSEGERCPDPPAVEVVRDLYRDLGNARLTGRLDVPRGGYERAVCLVDRRQRLVVDMIDVDEVRELALAELGLRREVAPAARLRRQARDEAAEPVTVFALDGPDPQAPAVFQLEPVAGRRAGTLGSGAQVGDVLLRSELDEVAVHRFLVISVAMRPSYV